ncbi:MAG: ROK family protein [Methanomicrobiaceae archaeon]|nr:ROK family protein [Methanomicrobiaceae archaeon]
MAHTGQGVTGEVITVDLGATRIRVALVSAGGVILRRAEAGTPTSGHSGDVVANRIGDLIASIGLSRGTACFQAVSVSAAGPIDSARGAVVSSPNMAFGRIDLVEPLAGQWGVPVYLMNDARAGIAGERWLGAARECENAVYITLSTGIGGGAIVDGRLLGGWHGNAGEIGHLYVDSRYGMRCGCGHEGHWEAYASGRSIPAFFTRWCSVEGCNPEAGRDVATAAALFQAVRDGDHCACAFADELGRINARGVSGVTVAYEPERIIFDGPVARENASLLLPQIERYRDRYLTVPSLHTSALGGDAPLLGAAAHAFDLQGLKF